MIPVTARNPEIDPETGFLSAPIPIAPTKGSPSRRISNKVWILSGTGLVSLTQYSCKYPDQRGGMQTGHGLPSLRAVGSACGSSKKEQTRSKTGKREPHLLSGCLARPSSLGDEHLAGLERSRAECAGDGEHHRAASTPLAVAH